MRLGPLALSHADGRYLAWLHDPEVTRFLEARLTDYDADRLRAYIAAEFERPNAVLFGMFMHQDGRLIGTIKLSEIRGTHRNCNIGLMIGEKSVWGQGYGTEAIALASGYAFDTLGMHKILAGCYAGNTGSFRAFIKAGYRIEGRLADDRWDGTAFVDRIVLGKINPGEMPAASSQSQRETA